MLLGGVLIDHVDKLLFHIDSDMLEMFVKLLLVLFEILLKLLLLDMFHGLFKKNLFDHVVHQVILI